MHHIMLLAALTGAYLASLPAHEMVEDRTSQDLQEVPGIHETHHHDMVEPKCVGLQPAYPILLLETGQIVHIKLKAHENWFRTLR